MKKIEIIEILNTVKIISPLGETEFFTIDLAAQYYEVNKSTMKMCIKNNKDELESDGLKVYKQKEIKEMLETIEFQGFKIPHRGLTLIPTKAMLRIAMKLTESDIARQVREKLLEVNPEIYRELMPENSLRIKKYEEEIGIFLEFAFGKDQVKRQVRCGDYNLDFVLFDEIHIEVDENGHNGYDYKKEKEREEYIFNNTLYTTIRYNPHKEKPYELMMRILEIIELTDGIVDTGIKLNWCLAPAV